MIRLRALFALSLSFSAMLASAQDTASLQGVVRDPSGAVVKAAAVTLTSSTKGGHQTLRTNADGIYTFPYIFPGTYSLTVKAQNFKTYTQAGLVIQTAEKSSVDVRLSVGEAQETVTVTTDRILMNDRDGSVGAVIDRSLIENLPLNGRSLQSLYTLVPGVTLAATGDSPSVTQGTILVNGQRAQSNQFIVNGGGGNVPAGNGISFAPNLPITTALGGTQGLTTVDELQEFRVLTSTYSAEYGTSPGGQFMLTTRSGTKQLHGSVYEYLRNEILDSNNWFNNAQGFPRGKLRQNLFGATLGGPLNIPGMYRSHERTFYFMTFEGLRLVRPISQVMNVPNMSLRAQAASVLQPILNLFPLPDKQDAPSGTPDSAPYTLNTSQPSASYTGAGRVDHTFGQKLTSFARYTRTPSTTSATDTATLFNNVTSEITTQSLTAGLTWTPTTNLGNDFRFNWTTTNSVNGSVSQIGGIDLFSYLQRTASDPQDSRSSIVFSLPSGTFSTSQGSGSAGSRQFYINDTMSFTHGAHLLKVGGNMRRLNATVSPNTYLASTAFQTNTVTTAKPDALYDIKNGIARSFSVTSTVKAEPIFYSYGLFINDEWKVTSRLQLQLGLRWEVNPVPGSLNGLSPTTYSGYPTFASMTVLPAGTPLYKTRYNNFAPRLGAAYRIGESAGKQTVVRVGGGLFYDTSDNQGARPYVYYPFGNSRTYSNVNFPFTSSMTAPPDPSKPIASPYGNLFAINQNLQLPVTYAWSAGVEQALNDRSSLTLTYVGNHGSQLMETAYLINIPNISSVQYVSNGANSSYNALQVQYQARLMHGLNAFGSYVWSHAIDDTSLQQTSYSIVRVRGNSDGDQRNVFRTGISYTAPSLKRGILNALFGEWGTDLNIGVQSGTPFTPRTGYNFIGTTDYEIIRPNVVPGVQRWIQNPTAPGGWQLNTKAFSVQSPARDANNRTIQGNLGRNVIYGFATGQADVALRKTFTLIEPLKLQFRAESFNLTNHPNFGSFNNAYSATSTTFGQATAMYGTALGGLNSLYQSGGPRSTQFALKLLF